MPRLITALLVLVLAGCGGDGGGSGNGSGNGSGDGAATGEQFPDVVEVAVSSDGGSYTFDVTMSSPYDSPERYADGMRVRSADGEVYGERELLHDHASEQPFTRSIDDVEIPDDVDEVVVEGRDQQSGWGGETQTVSVN